MPGLRQVVQPANSVAGVGHGKSVVLRSRRSICCRSLVCGMPFCVAGAVFRTLYTPHSHFTLHTFGFTFPTLHFTLHTFTPHFTLVAPHSTPHTSKPRLYTLHSTLHNPPLHTLLTTFPTQHSTFFTLRTLHPTPFHCSTGTVTGEKCTRLFK